MGPISNGLGEVFHYIVMAQGDDRTKPRTIHDWVIRPQMRTVPGVAEVNPWGGYQRQYQVRIEPEALVKYDRLWEEGRKLLAENPDSCATLYKDKAFSPDISLILIQCYSATALLAVEQGVVTTTSSSGARPPRDRV